MVRPSIQRFELTRKGGKRYSRSLRISIVHHMSEAVHSGSMPSQNGTLHGVSIRHLGRSLADFFAGRFSSGPGERRARLVLLLLSALSLMFLVNPRQHFLNVAYNAGDIASSGVKATQDYLLEDAPLTEKKRKEAERSAPL